MRLKEEKKKIGAKGESRGDKIDLRKNEERAENRFWRIN